MPMPTTANFLRSGVYVTYNNKQIDLIAETGDDEFAFLLNKTSQETSFIKPSIIHDSYVDGPFNIKQKYHLVKEFMKEGVEFELNEQEFSEFEKRILEISKQA